MADSASADNAWESVVNGNVSGNSVQFDYRGGSATYNTTVTDGSTVTVAINNTNANCIGSCTPIPDNWTVSINGQSFSGNAIEATSVSAVVSGQATINVSGIDNGFWAGWYGPIFTVSFSSPTPVQSPEPSPSASPSPSPSPEPTVIPEPSASPLPVESPTASSSPEPTSSPTPSPEPTPTPMPETPSPSPAPQNNVVNGSANEGSGLSLSAPMGKIFTSVIFASYGTPNGYSIGQCHAPNSIEKVAEIFLGKAIATIMAINDVFGDPCGGTYKSLAVSLAYGEAPAEPSPSPSPEPSSASPAPSPEPTPTAAEPQPSPQPTPTETATNPQPSPSPSVPMPSPTSESTSTETPAPQPAVSPTPQPQPTQEPSQSIPEPTPLPSPTPPPAVEPEPIPEPEPSPSPDVAPTPDETPIPEPSPEPVPSEPEPTPAPEPQPEPSPEPVEPPEVAPEPEPEPTEPPPPVEEPSPEPPSDNPSEVLENILADGDVTANEVASIVDSANADGKFTKEERKIVAEAIVAQFMDAPAVPATALIEAGLDFADLPAETPVDVRTDENGNAVIITAEVADALELLASPAEMLSAIFESPGQLLFALGNLGADMSPAEREEATKTIIAATIVGNIATTTMATAVGGIGYRRP